MVEAMATKIVTVQQAEGHLFELIALVERAEEVIITYDDQPEVKSVPMIKPAPKRMESARTTIDGNFASH
jgi:antitoxin (DNA-binding transcriptional repressor) of toxin-antitoxin stability system